jgi:hypothetical protein
MESFFRRRAVNLLFPVAVTAASLALALLVARAIDDNATPATAIGTTLVATMLALAIVEHWMLVLPLDTTALWRWAIREAGRRNTPRPCSLHRPKPPCHWNRDEKLLRAR